MKTLSFRLINNEDYFETREDVYILISTLATTTIKKEETRSYSGKSYTFCGRDYIWNRPLIEVNYTRELKVGGMGDRVFVLSLKDPYFIRSLLSNDHSGLLEIIEEKYNTLTPYTSYTLPSFIENKTFHYIYGVYKVVSQIEGRRLCSIPKKKLLDDFYRKYSHVDITLRSKNILNSSHQCIGRKKHFIKYKLLRQATKEDISSLKELPKRYGRSFGYTTNNDEYFYVEVKECHKEKKLLYNILNNVRNPKAIVTQEKKKYVISLNLLCYICNYDFGFTKMSGENDTD